MCKLSEDFPSSMFKTPISSSLPLMSIENYNIILILLSNDSVYFKLPPVLWIVFLCATFTFWNTYIHTYSFVPPISVSTMAKKYGTRQYKCGCQPQQNTKTTITKTHTLRDTYQSNPQLLLVLFYNYSNLTLIKNI
jgi:hypothetical protein